MSSSALLNSDQYIFFKHLIKKHSSVMKTVVSDRHKHQPLMISSGPMKNVNKCQTE